MYTIKVQVVDSKTGEQVFSVEVESVPKNHLFPAGATTPVLKSAISCLLVRSWQDERGE